MTTASTTGLEIHTGKRWLRNGVELLSSMRFAIALLAILSVASIIGTVIRQSEPFPNYVNQFGPFWAEIFRALSLYTVYSAWWFLLILAVLVTSTSLCIARNAPKMLADMRAWKDHVREGSLRAFHHRLEAVSPMGREALDARLGTLIDRHGYKLVRKGHDQATLIAAKRGGGNKLGYIFAHSAIVIICVGGLLDGDLFLRAQMMLGNKSPLPPSAQGMLISDIPERHRLGMENPSFRANILVPEGSSTSAAVLLTPDGSLIQDLPFAIRLKKFTVEHYSTGMPKLFASDIVIVDRATGTERSAVVEVNKPVFHDGIAIYQSSFEDGGSRLKLKGFPMRGSDARTFEVGGEIGGSAPLAHKDGGEEYTIEFSGFRLMNVENVTDAEGRDDARGVARKSLTENFEARLGSGAKTSQVRDLRNVGPSVQYKLRDRAGQAREFSNYMLPVQIDGQSMFLAGVRDTPSESFRYLRIPADQNNSLDDWMRLRALIHDPSARATAARRFAATAVPAVGDATQKATLQRQLEESALRALDLFAGSMPADEAAAGKSRSPAGFQAVAAFLDKSVPQEEQQKAAEVLLKILNGGIWELWRMAREQAGLPAPAIDSQNSRFAEAAVNALSDSFLYDAPVLLQLDDFEQLQASVFQVTRSPGKNVVYLGCLLLVAGVFAMFYIRERRMWVWLRDSDDKSGTQMLMAMSTARRTLDFDKEFESMKALVLQVADAAPVGSAAPSRST